MENKKEPITKLEIGENEVYVGDLKVKDRYQLLIRHINLMNNTLSLIAQENAIQAICLQELCKKNGIDIDRIINNKG